MTDLSQFDKEIERLRIALENTLRILAVETVKWFQSQMNKEEDIDGNTYKKRRHSTKRQAGKRILQDRGNLKNSIEVKELNFENLSFTIGITSVKGADILKYAEAHNEGATITITEQMQKFFWAKFYEVGGKQTRTRTGRASKSQRNQQLGKDAQFWKSLALKKVGDTIQIPKRQFMGESSLLIQHLNNIAQDIFNDFYKE